MGLCTFQCLCLPFLAGTLKDPSDLLHSLTSFPTLSLHAPCKPVILRCRFAFREPAMLFLAFIIGPCCSCCLKCPPSSHFTGLILTHYIFWTSLPQIRWIRHVPLSSFRPYACICHKIYHTLFVHMYIPLSFVYINTLAKCLAFSRWLKYSLKNVQSMNNWL